MENLKAELNNAIGYFLDVHKDQEVNNNIQHEILYSKRNDARNSLDYLYRLIIANGNFEGGNAKYMNDIDITISRNGAARVTYKNNLMGYYSYDNYEKLTNLRNLIFELVEKEWFQKEIEEANKNHEKPNTKTIVGHSHTSTINDSGHVDTINNLKIPYNKNIKTHWKN